MKSGLERASERSVSRETEDRLLLYAELLRKWNPKINLVAPSTINDLDERHFQDSAQLLRFAPISGAWADLGAGAGFPGMVVAILAAGQELDLSITLVESDVRKAAFLREVARVTETDVNVLSERIEGMTSGKFDIVSARALAPLPRLFDYAAALLREGGQCLFLKGERYQQEVDEARKGWHFTCNATPSLVGDGVVISAKDLRRV